MRPNVVRRLPLLLVLVIGIAACGEASEPGAPAAAGATLPVGRTFVATGASDGGRDRPLAAEASITFRADGRTSVATGCNSAGGNARLVDGRLVTDDFAATLMGCVDPAVSEQETFVRSVVEGQPQLLLDGDVLVLRTATAEIRFLDQKVAVPDRPLEGTRWQVTTVFDAAVAGSVMAPHPVLVLANGHARVTGPCSDLDGPATVTGATVELGALAKGAARPCEEGDQRTEADMVRLLTGTLRATVTARNLRLERADGSGLMLAAES